MKMTEKELQKQLELSINTFKKITNEKNLIRILRTINEINVLIPLYKSKPLMPYVISDANHPYLMPIFTKADYIPEQWKKSEMLNLPFSKAVEFIESNSKHQVYMVLNIEKHDFILEKKAIELFHQMNSQ